QRASVCGGAAVKTTALKTTAARLVPYALPFARTIRTARGRFTHRRGWLLGIEQAGGEMGWGDAAPWPGFGSSEEQVASELAALIDDRALEGLCFDSASEVWRWLEAQRLVPEVAYAVELALLD